MNFCSLNMRNMNIKCKPCESKTGNRSKVWEKSVSASLTSDQGSKLLKLSRTDRVSRLGNLFFSGVLVSPRVWVLDALLFLLISKICLISEFFPQFQGSHGFLGSSSSPGFAGYTGSPGSPGFPGFPGFPGSPGSLGISGS